MLSEPTRKYSRERSVHHLHSLPEPALARRRQSETNWHSYPADSDSFIELKGKRIGRRKRLILQEIILKTPQLSIRSGRLPSMIWLSEDRRSQAKTNGYGDPADYQWLSRNRGKRMGRRKRLILQEIILKNPQLSIRSDRLPSMIWLSERPIGTSLRPMGLRIVLIMKGLTETQTSKWGA